MHPYELNDDEPIHNPITITQIHDDIHKIKFNSLNTLKILYINARSVKNKLDEKTHIKNTFKGVIVIHIIAITETFVRQGEEEFYGIDGYTAHYFGRPNRDGGGVAVLVKNNIQHEITNKWSDDDNSFINLQIQVNNKLCNIMNVYRPPNNYTHKKTDFICELNQHLDKLQRQNTIITGDFNFNTIDEEDQHVQAYLNVMYSNGM